MKALGLKTKMCCPIESFMITNYLFDLMVKVTVISDLIIRGFGDRI